MENGGRIFEVVRFLRGFRVEWMLGGLRVWLLSGIEMGRSRGASILECFVCFVKAIVCFCVEVCMRCELLWMRGWHECSHLFGVEGL